MLWKERARIRKNVYKYGKRWLTRTRAAKSNAKVLKAVAVLEQSPHSRATGASPYDSESDSATSTSMADDVGSRVRGSSSKPDKPSSSSLQGTKPRSSRVAPLDFTALPIHQLGPSSTTVRPSARPSGRDMLVVPIDQIAPAPSADVISAVANQEPVAFGVPLVSTVPFLKPRVGAVSTSESSRKLSLNWSQTPGSRTSSMPSATDGFDASAQPSVPSASDNSETAARAMEALTHEPHRQLLAPLTNAPRGADDPLLRKPRGSSRLRLAPLPLDTAEVTGDGNDELVDAGADVVVPYARSDAEPANRQHHHHQRSRRGQQRPLGSIAEAMAPESSSSAEAPVVDSAAGAAVPSSDCLESPLARPSSTRLQLLTLTQTLTQTRSVSPRADVATADVVEQPEETMSAGVSALNLLSTRPSVTPGVVTRELPSQLLPQQSIRSQAPRRSSLPTTRKEAIVAAGVSSRYLLPGRSRPTMTPVTQPEDSGDTEVLNAVSNVIAAAVTNGAESSPLCPPSGVTVRRLGSVDDANPRTAVNSDVTAVSAISSTSWLNRYVSNRSSTTSRRLSMPSTRLEGESMTQASASPGFMAGGVGSTSLSTSRRLSITLPFASRRNSSTGPPLDALSSDGSTPRSGSSDGLRQADQGGEADGGGSDGSDISSVSSIDTDDNGALGQPRPRRASIVEIGAALVLPRYQRLCNAITSQSWYQWSAAVLDVVCYLCKAITSSRSFDKFIILVIVLNTISIGIEHYDMSSELVYIEAVLEIVFASIFTTGVCSCVHLHAPRAV